MGTFLFIALLVLVISDISVIIFEKIKKRKEKNDA